MIADFGLSRVLDDEKFQMLTEICGTPGVGSSDIHGANGTVVADALSTVHGPGDLQEK